MRIYTRTGDGGETSLFSGERVRKNHDLVEVYGTVDEACSALGLALALGLCPPVADATREVQGWLFKLGGDLATLPGGRRGVVIGAGDIAEIEARIDAASAELPALRNFILPGGTGGAACLHLARTVIRRAERLAIGATAPIRREALIFLNRLSDYLFVLARWENHLAGQAETKWEPQ